MLERGHGRIQMLAHSELVSCTALTKSSALGCVSATLRKNC